MTTLTTRYGHADPVRRIATLLGCLLVSFAPGIVGSRFGPGDWYDSIEKSPLTPPGWVFPVAWTLLYALMGIALWRFLETTRTARSRGVALFGTQLVLNGLWSYLFFGLHQPGAALVEIAMLWIAIAASLIEFARHSRTAAALLAPYLAWVSFAAYLNFFVWSHL